MVLADFKPSWPFSDIRRMASEKAAAYPDLAMAVEVRSWWDDSIWVRYWWSKLFQEDIDQMAEHEARQKADADKRHQDILAKRRGRKR